MLHHNMEEFYKYKCHKKLRIQLFPQINKLKILLINKNYKQEYRIYKLMIINLIYNHKKY